MARITKAALEQQVVALQAQVEELQAALALSTQALVDARIACDVLQAQHVAHSLPSRRIVAVMPAWQAERAAAMAAAREAAMRLGVTTKVTSC